MIYDNILQTIDNTPMVKINCLNPNPDVNVYAKTVVPDNLRSVLRPGGKDHVEEIEKPPH